MLELFQTNILNINYIWDRFRPHFLICNEEMESLSWKFLFLNALSRTNEHFGYNRMLAEEFDAIFSPNYQQHALELTIKDCKYRNLQSKAV